MLIAILRGVMWICHRVADDEFAACRFKRARLSNTSENFYRSAYCYIV